MMLQELAITWPSGYLNSIQIGFPFHSVEFLSPVQVGGLSKDDLKSVYLKGI